MYRRLYRQSRTRTTNKGVLTSKGRSRLTAWRAISPGCSANASWVERRQVMVLRLMVSNQRDQLAALVFSVSTNGRALGGLRRDG